MFEPCNQGLLRAFHSDDSETAADRRPLISGIYSMFPPALEAGATDATGSISDSDSPMILDMSIKEDDFSVGDLREFCFSGVDGGEGYSLGLRTDPVGVGGSTLITGTKEGESAISLVPLDVNVKCVS